jgi:hypothetical protein
MKKGRVAIVVLLLALACLASGFIGCSCNSSADNEHVNKPTSRYETMCEFPNQDLMDIELYNIKIPGDSVKASAEKTDDVLQSVNINYRSGSDFGDIVDWYENNLGAPAENTTNDHGEKNAVWHSTKDGYTTTVTVFKHPDSGDASIDVTRKKS